MASSLSSAQQRWAFAALLTGATGIGFAPVLVRLSETGPTATAFYRLLFALPIIWLWMALAHQQPGEIQPRTARAFGGLALSGLLFAADLSIWHWALQFTTVTNSTLITNLAPLLVAAVAWLFLGEKATRTFILGLLIATAGAAVLVGNSYVLSARHLLGDLLSLVAAVFYAGYLVTLRHLRATFSTPVIMAWAGLSSCVGFAVVAWASGDVMWPATHRGWMVLVALALGSHLGGQTFIAYGFGHLPAALSSVTLLWQPVVAAAAAWMVLGEPLSWAQGAGALIVLAGIATSSGWQPWRSRALSVER
jgi:drug/metabolite transporter (DMT)-like permease